MGRNSVNEYCGLSAFLYSFTLTTAEWGSKLGVGMSSWESGGNLDRVGT